MEVTLNSKRTSIPADPFSAGGEGNVYKKGNELIKIFFNPKADIEMRTKELAPVRSPQVLAPKFVAYSGNTAVGYSMDFVDNAVPLTSLYSNSFVKRHNLTKDNFLKIARSLRDIIQVLHKNNVVLVDCNEYNFLVDKKTFSKVYAIDTDSYQTKSLKATAILPTIQDPLTIGNNDFNEGSDWYSYAILILQLYTGLHPFKGRYLPDPKMKLPERMKAGISIFNTDVKTPAAMRPVLEIPGNLRNWMNDVFTNGKRCEPPKDFSGTYLQAPSSTIPSQKPVQVTGAIQTTLLNKVPNRISEIPCNGIFIRNMKGMEKIVEWFSGYASYTLTVKNGSLYVIEKGGEQLVTEAKDVQIIDGRLYVLGSHTLSEIQDINGKLVVNSKVDRVALYSEFRDGLVLSQWNANMGFVLPIGSGKSVMYTFPEIKHAKILDASLKGRVLQVNYYKDGEYQIGFFIFTKNFSSYTFDSIEVSGPSECHTVMNYKGFFISYIPPEEELVIIVPDIAKVNIVRDISLPDDLTLGTEGQDVVMFTGDEKYKISFSG